MTGSVDASPSDTVLRGRSILVTGGAGSFGQAFVKRCLESGARKVVVYSRDEAKHAAMSREFSDRRLRFFVGDVRDKSRLFWALRDIDVCVHAAALKRVETCEADPSEAVATNVYGTENVASVCIERGVGRCVLLSTDKAAAPNTLYGSTKLTAERIWNAYNAYAAGTATRFAATRYGNVIGSRGSVVPLFRAQAQDGCLKLTDFAMTRFWMRMTEAVDLVVLALSEMRGGEVFVPKIGAASVASLGSAIAPDARQVSTGIRPGEKIHETLVTDDEARRTHDCGAHYVIEPTERSWGDVAPLSFLSLVPDGFTYRSDTARQYSVDELRALVAA